MRFKIQEKKVGKKKTYRAYVNEFSPSNYLFLLIPVIGWIVFTFKFKFRWYGLCKGREENGFFSEEKRTFNDFDSASKCCQEYLETCLRDKFRESKTKKIKIQTFETK